MLKIVLLEGCRTIHIVTTSMNRKQTTRPHNCRTFDAFPQRVVGMVVVVMVARL